MSWTTLILASAFFLAVYDLLKKASVRENDVLAVLFFATVAGSSVFVTAWFLAARFGLVAEGPATVLRPSAAFFGLIVLKTCIVASSWIFTFNALRGLPITVATPIRATAPAWTFLAAIFLYGEIPSWIQALGMLLTFVGYFVFSWAGKSEGIDFRRNRFVWFALGGMLLSSVSALWDKFLLQRLALDRVAVQFWFQVDLVFFYGLCLGARRLCGWRHPAFAWRRTVPFVGIFLACADFLYFAAMATPDVPVSIASLMRRVSVVITFALGARMFRETNLVRKGLALALVLTGVTLLCL